MLDAEGAFHGICSRVVISFSYDQPSSSTVGVLLPKSLRHLFQWSDDEGEASGYASSAILSSMQIGRVSANMADNNNDDDRRRRMEAQEQTSKAQQEALDNIQQMLAQFLINWNNDTTGSNHDEGNLNNEHLKTEKSKESSSIGADILKCIQAQIESLTQRDELKKVGITCPYPLEWDSMSYSPKFKPPMLHTYDGKSTPN